MKKLCLVASLVVLLSTLAAPAHAQKANAAEGSAQKSSSVRVVTQKAQVLTRPASGADVRMTIGQGTVLDVIDTDGRWYWVSLPADNGGTRQRGWIQARDVEAVGPDLSTEVRDLTEKVKQLQQQLNAKQSPPNTPTEGSATLPEFAPTPQTPLGQQSKETPRPAEQGRRDNDSPAPTPRPISGAQTSRPADPSPAFHQTTPNHVAATALAQQPGLELTRIQVVKVDNHKVGVKFLHESVISHMTVNGNDGRQYEIRCGAHTEFQHCVNLAEGSSTSAMVENNDTMWISYLNGADRNKPSRAKYDILSSAEIGDVSVGGTAVPEVLIPSAPTEILRVSKEWSVGSRYVISVIAGDNKAGKQTVTVLRIATFDEWLAEYTKQGVAPSPAQIELARKPSARFYEVNWWRK